MWVIGIQIRNHAIYSHFADVLWRIESVKCVYVSLAAVGTIYAFVSVITND